MNIFHIQNPISTRNIVQKCQSYQQALACHSRPRPKSQARISLVPLNILASKERNAQTPRARARNTDPRPALRTVGTRSILQRRTGNGNLARPAIDTAEEEVKVGQRGAAGIRVTPTIIDCAGDVGEIRVLGVGGDVEAGSARVQDQIERGRAELLPVGAEGDLRRDPEAA